MKISVLILTLNEELNIKECIESISALTDDIIVLDSYSDDETVNIASMHGARVIRHKFSGWADHQNWALKNIKFKHEWVLYIDADERVTHELCDEIRELKLNDYKAYKIFRDNRFIHGESLKYSMKCPGIIRLFSVKHIQYQREINPVALVNGRVGILNAKLVHYNFSKGLDEWVLKHIDYAKREARENKTKKNNKNLSFLKQRTTGIKYFRFVLRMIYQLIFKMGMLDGYAGFRYAVLISFYEQLIEENMR